MSHTQLTPATNYDINRMIFSVPNENKIPNSTFTYKRINISTKNADGTVGDLVIRTPLLFSFGVQENKSQSVPAETIGWSLPLCLWNRNGPSKEETEWTDTFNNICQHTKEYLVKNRKDIGKWDLELGDLKSFNPLYWKRNSEGKIEGGPTLYAKLIVSKRDGKDSIKSGFYDAENNDALNPLDILGKYCTVVAAIKIESVFIGVKLSLQVKLWEVQVTLQSSGFKRLLSSNPSTGNNIEEEKFFDDASDDHSDASYKSDFISDQEEVVAPQPSPPNTRKKALTKKK